MKFLPFFTSLIVISAKCWSQDSLLVDFNSYKEISISIGYNYSFGEPNKKNFHLLDTRIQKQKYGGIHPNFVNISTGWLTGINTNKFLVAPLIGGQIGYGGIFLGVDIAYFTSFKEGTLRIIPMLGIGFSQFRMSLNLHAPVTNTDYEPVDMANINISFRLLQLKKQRL